MAFPLSSFALQSFPSSSSQIEESFTGKLRPFNLLLPRHSLSSSTLTFSRRKTRNSEITISSNSSSKNKKKKSLSTEGKRKKNEDEEEDMDEDAFEALFQMLEEDLKNDVTLGSDGDDEDDVTEEDIQKLQNALELVLGIGGDDDDDVEIESSDVIDVGDGSGDFENDDDIEDDDEDEEEERPVKLKNWQMRRLARALKNGRRRISIKSLAAELCLDRALVLELLRDPPPNLVMMSAAMLDEPEPKPVKAQTKPMDIIPLETTTMADVKSENEKKVPVHVMQQSWSAQKRIKKAHLETLERVYRKSKRPTNAMISSIVQVTNLPRKKVVKWFEDKRNADGVPEQRTPYQRSTPEAVSSV